MRVTVFSVLLKHNFLHEVSDTTSVYFVRILKTLLPQEKLKSKLRKRISKQFGLQIGLSDCKFYIRRRNVGDILASFRQVT
jgi:hypothetical protein